LLVVTINFVNDNRQQKLQKSIDNSKEMMGIFLSKFGKFEKDLPDVSGKVFVITGTTSGTGFNAAKTVAKHNGTALLLNRPSSRSVASLDKLKEAVPEGKFVPIDCDLQSFDSVRKACKEIKTKYTSIYCLANNAGIMATPDEITADGYEKQMQTNHLSHFLLTKELFPLLEASSKECGDARIVQHSSLARQRPESLEEKFLSKQEKAGMLGGDDPSAKMLTGPEWTRYQHTKLANSVFCQALHNKLSSSTDKIRSNIKSLCAHPGWSTTNLSDHLSVSFFARIIFIPIMFFSAQSPEDGSMGLIKGMMEKPGNVKSGVLYGPNGDKGYAVGLPSLPSETDPKSISMLWKKSEEATGVSFPL
jgi:NAD(P)-dependent dehydrogenase (short-subunit alcohol dehydrogenase family)